MIQAMMGIAKSVQSELRIKRRLIDDDTLS
jgi:hypothetical protein